MRVGTSPPSSTATTAIATSVTIACVMPVFLTGGMAVQLREELGLGVTALGVVMSSFVAAQALCSRSLGRRADRMGSTAALRLAALIALASSTLLAVAVRDVVGLTLSLSLAGVANALGQPAASRLLARAAAQHRQGLVFGVFQSSKPVAGLLSGLAVPLLALTVGWRWAYALTAVATLVLLVLLPRGREAPDVRPPAAHQPTALHRAVRLPLVLGAALGFGAVKVFATFLVDGGVVAGLRPAVAGLVLSLCSLLAVTSRLTVGLFADRRQGHQLRLVAAMLATGSVGFLLMALQRPAPVVVGAVLVAMGVWGYNGLFFLSMTRLLAAAPGAITGLMLSSASVGGVVAPLAFGVAVDRWSYTIGWLLTGLWALVAGVAVHLAQARIGIGHARAPTRGT